MLRATQTLKPDLIAVTGDLVDDRPEDVAAYAKIFGALDAPLGVYIIPGNHDVYAGWDDVERALRAAEFGTVLVNEVDVASARDATRSRLSAPAIPAGGRRGTSRAAPDIDRALADVPANVTVIAFAHNPALWPALAARGVALTLSGHTHWGAVCAAETRLEPRLPLPRSTRWRLTWSATRFSISARAPAIGEFPSVSARVRKSL